MTTHNADTVVWVVFETHRFDDLPESIWTTKDAAQKRADQIHREKGYDTFVDDYPLLIDGSDD